MLPVIGKVDARRVSRIRGNSLQSGRQMPGGRSPFGEGAVVAAIHAYAAITPWLLRNPVDDHTRIRPIELEGRNRPPAAPLTAGESHDTHISMGRTFLCKGVRIHIDRELQQGGQRFCFSVGPNHNR